ncbi:hypothetical protein [Nonomuraea sediminis]|uniref:hypothetical protein n=1 Tax=Nonomuraea sediminis TaxID=2835864 RepID=UPI001BDCF2A4|nr:hypothetical protein [Nonomuraea sediminis]
MARRVVSEFMTVDGYMEDPGGAENLARGGWRVDPVTAAHPVGDDGVAILTYEPRR